MSTPIPSNKFLNTVLRASALALSAAAAVLESAVIPVQKLLTYDPQTPGQSSKGANPTCHDVINQVDLETIETVDKAFVQVKRISQAAIHLYDSVYPVIHQTHWERSRQSPVHRPTTPATYVAP